MPGIRIIIFSLQFLIIVGGDYEYITPELFLLLMTSLFTFYHCLLSAIIFCHFHVIGVGPYPTFTLPYLISSYLLLPYILPYLTSYLPTFRYLTSYLTLPHIFLPFVTLHLTLPHLTFRYFTL